MFTIDRSSGIPLYHQLYKQLLAQIRAGQLPAGSRLPGSRTLAASLGLGRNTVDNAYSQLAAEGYLQAAPGQGFRVMPLPQLLPDRQPAPEPAAPPLPPEPPVRYDLFYGSLSPRDFPFRPWRAYDRDLAAYNCMVPWLMQRTLGQFMAQGHYQRLVRRLRTKFRRTHDLLQKELRSLSPDVQIVSQGYALKFLLAFPPHMTRQWLMDRALVQGVKVYSPESHWLDPRRCPPNLLQLGFTAMEPEDIAPCIQRLKAAWFPEA